MNTGLFGLGLICQRSSALRELPDGCAHRVVSRLQEFSGVWLAFSSVGRPSQTGGRVGNRAAASHARRRRHQLSAASGLVAGVLAYLLTGLAIAGVMAAVAKSSFLPRIVEDRKRQRDAHRRRQAWPDVIDSLVSAVRAGMSLPEAVAAVGVQGPQVVRPAFVRFAADYRASGRFTDCILRLRDDVQDPVADRIVEALLAARDVGGSDLGRMLRTLSDFVRQDLRFRGEAEARRSWTVNGRGWRSPRRGWCSCCCRPGQRRLWRTRPRRGCSSWSPAPVHASWRTTHDEDWSATR